MGAAPTDGTGVHIPDILHLLLQLLLQILGIPNKLDIGFPGRRQPHWPHTSVKNRHSQRILNLSNCHAQGRLGQKKILRRFAEALFLVYPVDVLHLCLHIGPPFFVSFTQESLL